MKTLIFRRESEAVNYLIDKDPMLRSLFEKKESIEVHIDSNYFVSLVGTITSQQLSSKVATVIYNRLKALCNHEITSSKILSLSDDELRGVGLSYQKIKYLRSLAECKEKQLIKLNELDHLSDLEIIEMLTQIKGIGVWSAQMFLLFSLGRTDVFSVLDLGLRNALKRLYNQPDLSNKEIELMSEKWIPYRSYVSHYLWHAWDNE
jgi:DNA-3-methyladenine glycosylase II